MDTMMLRSVAILAAVICLANCFPAQKQSSPKGKQNLFETQLNEQQKSKQQQQQQQHITQQDEYAHILGQQPAQQQHQEQQQPSQGQYPPAFPYLTLLEPQYQLPAAGVNFIQDPRIQPQILLYSPAGHGQPFLLQPASPPPGNFLVPQPGPNVILRDPQPQPQPHPQPQPFPQRPVFLSGFPKPAHIPPVEKDAEEIPTSPSKIPNIRNSGRKPEKIETFNEGKEYPTKVSTEEIPSIPEEKPIFPKTNLRPGQRFFILNGQPLFDNYLNFAPNYPVQGNFNYKYAPVQSPAQASQISSAKQEIEFKPEYKPDLEINQIPIQNLLLRNAVTGHISDVVQNEFLPPYSSKYSENVVESGKPNQHQQPQQEEAIFRSYPINLAPSSIKDIGQDFQFRFQGDDFYPYQSTFGDDSVVIEAKQEDPSTNNDSETVSSSDPKNTEPSISQAQPGAIALAGPGGVAGAAPRGTALVGKGGLAVSSPQATAVAGTKKSEEGEKPQKHPTKH